MSRAKIDAPRDMRKQNDPAALHPQEAPLGPVKVKMSKEQRNKIIAKARDHNDRLRNQNYPAALHPQEAPLGPVKVKMSKEQRSTIIAKARDRLRKQNYHLQEAPIGSA